jgi:hypothetical protein
VESVNFDRAAGYYDATRALPGTTMAQLTALLAAELAERQPCLEIGVGTGRFALPLRAAGIAMAGTDISGAMLRRLAEGGGRRRAGLGRRRGPAARDRARDRDRRALLGLRTQVMTWRAAGRPALAG